MIAEKITAGWTKGHAVDHTFASVWDEGVMLAARRSWWRIAADITDQSARPIVPTWRGKAFKGYSIIDIWSRKITGWRVEERESDHLAVEMFQAAFRHDGAPQFVHADSGPAMRSGALADLLTEHNAVSYTHLTLPTNREV